MQTFLLKHTRNHFLPTLLALMAAFSAQAQTINMPKLTQSAPGGSVTTTRPSIPAITVNTSALFNYERSFVPRVPVDDPASLSTASLPSEVQVSTSYKDGFNRNMQVVKHHFTPGKSLVIPSDTRFRPDAISLLPYAAYGFGFRANAFEEQSAFYASVHPGEGNTAYGHDRNTSNASERSRSHYAPGKSQVGQGRASRVVQATNGLGEVRNWVVNGSGLPASNGTYPAGQLFLETVRTPNGDPGNVLPSGFKRTFRDKDGRIVLEQIADSTIVITTTPYTLGPTYLSTYYAYDDQGQLSAIIPPGAVQLLENSGWAMTAPILNQYCFQYKYDDKGRKVEQKVPGKGWEYFIYDKRDRMVLYQDQNLRDMRKWVFHTYDPLNRELSSGMTIASGGREQTAAYLDFTTSWPTTEVMYYLSNHNIDLWQSYPPESLDMLSYTYYDDYQKADPNRAFWNTYNSVLQFSELQSIPGAETPVRSLMTQGMVTGSKLRILPSPGADAALTGVWRHTALFYDDKGRMIYSVSEDRDNNQAAVHASYSGIQYHFSGQALAGKHVQVNFKARDGYQQHTEISRNDYEPATGRLAKTSRKVDAYPWVTTATFAYDEQGRMIKKALGNNGEIQNFSYNMSGTLAGINGIYAQTGDKQGMNMTFGESLKYDYGFDLPRYDGKIAGIVWRGSNGDAAVAGAPMHAYGYDYDLSGRLRSADYYLQSQTPWSKSQLDFSVSNLWYDKGGNLKSMKQRGVQPGAGPVDMDVLRYSYAGGNQLDAVTDNGVTDYGAGDFHDNGAYGAGDYAYDPNGNLKQDLNKGISSITYNHLNRPVEIFLPGGKKIEYSYDAGGAKVQELIVSPGKQVKRTDYISNFVYTNDTLQFALTSDGRTTFAETSVAPKEEYFVKDHLGNVRSTIDITTYAIRQYLATYEVASANLEGLLFEKVGEIRDNKPGSTDPGDNKAGRLNAAEAERATGTSLLVKVMAGDRVDMNVNNYYESYGAENDQPLSPDEMLESIIKTLTNGVGGLPGESHNTKLVTNIFSSNNFNALNELIASKGIDPDRPQAFLTYALFDETMKLVSEFSGAYQVNGTGTWGSIGSDGARIIPRNGYLAVYLNSRWRDATCVPCSNVFFDKLKVEISKGNLLEENHYYPHGLPIKVLGSTATSFKENRRKYQGNEYIQDLGLNWMDFNARQYDPQVGRFLSIDPLADAGGQQLWSPYAAMGNAPESIVDPNGMIVIDSKTLVEANAAPHPMDVAIANYYSLLRSGGADPFSVAMDHGWMMIVNVAMREAKREMASKVTSGIVSTGELHGSFSNNDYSDGDDPDPHGKRGEAQDGDFDIIRFEESGGHNNMGQYRGIKIEIAFYKDKGYEKTDWIQTYVSTAQIDGADRGKWMLDGKSGRYPFYYDEGERSAASRIAYNSSWTDYFKDNPGRGAGNGDYSWTAQLSLVGFKNGRWTNIATWVYGYSIINGQMYKMYPTIVKPSQNQQSYINQKK